LVGKASPASWSEVISPFVPILTLKLPFVSVCPDARELSKSEAVTTNALNESERMRVFISCFQKEALTDTRGPAAELGA
jgi:hypothetical protein